MAGYFIGGQLADKYPRSEVLGYAVLAAAMLLGVTPPIASPLLDFMLDKAGDGVGSMLASACCCCSFLSRCCRSSRHSPVRLVLKEARHAGAVSGAIYSINTIGNVVGTLGVSLALIPVMGSRNITYLFAGVIAICGVALIALRARGYDEI